MTIFWPRCTWMIAAFVFAAALSAAGQQHRFGHAAALPENGKREQVMVAVESNKNNNLISLTYQIPEAEVSSTAQTYSGDVLSEVSAGNALNSSAEGEPVLPVIPAYVVIPEGYSLEGVDVVNTRSKAIAGVHHIRFGEPNIPLKKGAIQRKASPKNEIYGSDDVYPKKQVEVTGIYNKRGVTIAALKVNPVTYRPKSGKVSSFSSMEIRVKLKKNVSALKGRRTRIHKQMFASMGLENPQEIETYTDSTSDESQQVGPLASICDPASSYQYILITADSLRNATNDYTVRNLIAQKQAHGISARIITTDTIYSNYTGIDNAEKIRNFIIDAYTNWETDFILLGGDANLIPIRMLYCNSDEGYDNVPSDLYYQCLDGNYNYDGDSYWGEPTDGPRGADVDLMAEVCIGRASAQNRSEMANFVYKTLLYENTSESSAFLRRAIMLGEELGFGGVSEYATATMEEIRLGSSSHGYSTIGFAASPLFNVDTVYDSPTYTWTASNLISRMNAGTYSIYNHLGHANETYDMKLSNSNLDALTNSNPFFVYSQGCDPGAFDTDCFAEHLTTSTRSGAFAGVLNARYGWGASNSTDGPSQRFNRQFWDAYFGEYMTNLGAINAKSHEDNIWDINGSDIRWCFYETNLFGDPQTPVRGRITGPSLSYASHVINDVSGGNGDGIINPGEYVNLTANLVNAGSDSAAGVQAVFSTTDAYCSFTDNTSSFGTIACCGSQKTALDAIRLNIGQNCPTPHTVTISCSIRDSRDSLWTSNFSLMVYSSSQVSGLVRSVTGGIPIAGATVTFTGPISGAVTTDASGRYMFGGIDGSYAIVADADNYLNSSPVNVTVPPNRTGIDFALRAAPQLNVSPGVIRTTLTAGDSTVRTVTIKNTVPAGNADLHYSIDIQRHLASGSITGIPALIKGLDTRTLTNNSPEHGIPLSGRLMPATQGNPKYDATSLRILYAAPMSDTSRVSELAAGLRSLSNVSTVTLLDCRGATPNLAFLQGYDIVIAGSNTSWSNAELMGNVLADYVDAGGKVILMCATFCSGGSWVLGGRIMTSGYSPFTTNTYSYSETVHATSFVSHQITENLRDISTGLYAYITTLQGNGQSLGVYTNGYQMAAFNPDKPVVSINVYSENGYWGGDLIAMMGNTFDYFTGGQWVSVNPDSGTLVPGDSARISVSFNSRQLLGGTYTAMLNISHDAENKESPFGLPCTLVVDGLRRLASSVSAVNFGNVWRGVGDTLELTLRNDGNEATAVTNMQCSNPAFRVLGQLPFTVQPFDSAKVLIIFTPPSLGSFSATLTITSNAEDNSQISVALQGQGVNGPQIAVSPGTIDQTLLAGDSVSRTLSITNGGGVPLVFNIDVGVNSTAAAQSYESSHFRQFSKGEVDTRIGQAVVLNSGGPDAFGYRWKDSDENGGPAYVWRDIKSIGTIMSSISSCDDCYEARSISFAFPFYGKTYSAIYVSSNGFITFGTGSSQISNYPLPSSSAPANLIDMLHDDLYPSSAGDIYVLDEGTQVTVQFDNVYAFNGSGYYTFQAVLKKDGTITLYYKSLTGTLNQCTVGIQDSSRTKGLTVAYNTTYLKNNLAVELRPQPKWLSVSPQQGTVAPGSTLTAAVKLNTYSLAGGQYTGGLSITHNGGGEVSPLLIPCNLVVDGVRRLSASPASISYSSIWAGRSDTAIVTLRNVGDEATQVSAITSNNPVFSHNATLPLLIRPGENVTFRVIYHPVATGTHNGVLTITSNAEDNPTISVSLSGVATAPPAIVLNPESFSRTLMSGDTLSDGLAIRNTGGDILSVSLQVTTPVSNSLVNNDAVQVPIQQAELIKTASSPEVAVTLPRLFTKGEALAENILVLSTTSVDNSILRVLSNLGLPYTQIQTGEFSTVNFNPYSVILVGMDGGTITEASVAALANAASSGKNLIMIGGTNLTSYYTGMQNYLLRHSNQTGWQTSVAPHGRIVDATNPLARGLPSTYTFTNSSTSYYMIRISDSDAHVAVNNGDGFPALVWKKIGNGILSYFTSTASNTYWANTADLTILQTVISNALSMSNAAWLRVTPNSGSIAAGNQFSPSVIFDARNIVGGRYAASLSVMHNDPLRSNPILIPCTLTVTGVKRLSIIPSSINFGRVVIGRDAVVACSLQNTGNDTSTVTSISLSNASFTTNLTTPVKVPPFGTIAAQVRYTPSHTGADEGTLRIISNAEDNPQLSMPLSGIGVFGPSASVNPDSLYYNLQPSNPVTVQRSYIRNSGDDTLVYSISSVGQISGPQLTVSEKRKLPEVQTNLIYDDNNLVNPFINGRVIVGMAPSILSPAQKILTNIGAVAVRELGTARNPKTGLSVNTARRAFLITLSDTTSQGVVKAISILKEDPTVKYAEPDYIVQAIAIPNDPSFSQLYAMYNNGQNGGTVDADIDATDVWNKHTGARNILIGIIDTGIDYLHPDLAANVWTNPGEIAGNGIDDDGNGFIDDIHGWDFVNDDSNPIDDHYHGTHCAGTIAGVGNNGIGVAGVMWNASLVALKFLSSSGSGSTSDAIDAVNYATAMGIQITSNSWGGGGFSQALMDAIALGGLFVAAAGNESTDNDQSPHYPSSYNLDNILAVAATDNNDQLASFSCYGRSSVDLGAPGVDIYSCSPGNGYRLLSGTSMATPHVSGAAGLIWSFNTSLTALQVKELLMDNVDHVASLTNKTVTGGRLNVDKAFSAAGPAWLSASPMAGGKISPRDSATILVSVNPAGLQAGRWIGRVVVATNDLSHQQLPIDVVTDIAGCKSLTASVNTISFPTLIVGQRDTVTFTLRNTCNAPVVVSQIRSSDNNFICLTSAPFTVAANGIRDIPVVFSPVQPSQHNATLTITSDAEDNPTILIQLSGTCIAGPQISVLPQAFNVEVSPGNSVQRMLTIANNGGANLVWSMGYCGGGTRSREIFDTIPGVQQRSFTCTHDLTETYWSDAGNDAFDGFGYPSVKVGTDSVPVNMLEGQRSYTIGGYHCTVRNSFAENHIYRMVIEPQTGENSSRSDITINLSGNMGSDGSETVRYDSVLVGTKWLRFYINTESNYPNYDPRVVFMIVPSQANQKDSVTYWQPSSGYVAMRARNISLPATVYIIPSYHNIDSIKVWMQKDLRNSASWLHASVDTGTTAGGNVSSVGLTFNATGLVEGIYTDTLRITHNGTNPSTPVTVPIVLRVTEGIPGSYSYKILSIGPSVATKVSGTQFSISNLKVGSGVTGRAAGTRYRVRLW